MKRNVKIFPELHIEQRLNAFRKKIAETMQKKWVDVIIIILIAIYMCDVIVNLIFDDSCQNSEQVQDALNDLRYLEMVIISIFVLEILLKVYGFGIKQYFKDRWYIVDAVIILATFVLVLIDILGITNSTSSVNQIKGIFRLFRIFLLIRKATEISRITTKRAKLSGFDVKSPVEKILDLLQSIKLSTKDKELVNDCTWAMDIISSNKLYEPILEEGISGEEKLEANQWLRSYGTQSTVSKETEGRRGTKFPVPIKDQRRLSSIVPGNNLGLKDKFFKLTPEVSEILENKINELEFDVFKFSTLTQKDDLALITYHLLDKNGIFDAINIIPEVFIEFIRKIQAGYLNNPYHNATHAADVVQTVNYLVIKGDFIQKTGIGKVEHAAMFISSAIHDYEHPGTNNPYQINSSSFFAIRYNDKSVLENHHVAASFGLMKDDAYNIFKNMTKDNYKLIRERIIAMVLGTDMAQHFSDVAQLKGRLAADFDIKKDKSMIMNLIVHSADISNPVKEYDIYKEWTDRILNEFFAQGDKERDAGLPISQLCDRYTTNKSKSQIGFIDFVVAPLWSLMKEVLPNINIANLDTNKQKWKDQIEFFDRELAELNARKDEEASKKDTEIKKESTPASSPAK